MKTTLFVIFSIICTLFLSCEKKDQNPEIETRSIQALTPGIYKLKGKVLETGSYPIKEYGFVYYYGNYDSIPLTDEIKLTLNEKLQSDSFSAIVNISNPGSFNYTRIFAKAYLTNEAGTIYGKPVCTEILRLQITEIVPSSGRPGDTITIKGRNFDMSSSNTIVTFNGVNAITTSATANFLKVIVPSNIYTYENNVSLRIKALNQPSDFQINFMLEPNPAGFSPKHGTWGTPITITGMGMNDAIITFGDLLEFYRCPSANSFNIYVPGEIKSEKFNIYMQRYGAKFQVPGGMFTMDKIKADNFAGLRCMRGSTITINGLLNMHPYQPINTLFINNLVIKGNPAFSSSLQFNIPENISPGKYTVSVSNSLDTAVLPKVIEIVAPEILSITPSSGYPNSSYIIKARNLLDITEANVFFGSESYNSTIIDSTTIKGHVPYKDGGTYSVYVKVGSNKLKCPDNFTILEPYLTSISPSSGAANTSIIIKGLGFGSGNNLIYVMFGDSYTTPMSSNNTEINVKVPSWIVPGKYNVKVIVSGYTIPTTLTFDVP